MISSRRLAREWALKILYQSDVGKMSIEESQNAALERLRREFVQRGSRAATGSLLEEYCLDAVTIHVGDVLAYFDATFDMALRECLDQIFGSAEYWRRMDVDFTFNRQSFNVLWETPRQSTPVMLPSETAALPPYILANENLNGPQRRRLLAFLIWAREALPAAAMGAFARETRIGRPDGANLKATQEYVHHRWRQFSQSIAERWRPTGQVVEKQASDWLRVAAFTLKLVTGVTTHREELDATLQTLATEWSLDRLVSVDRNILRMAAFELTYLEGVPASATINEAVELAKKYSTAESGRFVNGVLGAIVTQVGLSVRPDEPAIPDTADIVENLDPEIDMDEIANEEELAHA